MLRHNSYLLVEMYYRIKNVLEASDEICIRDCKNQFVAILTSDEWNESKNNFDMGIDIEPFHEEILSSEAKVNYDSITGTFSIPNRSDFSGSPMTFAFALDEKGIVFIDDNGNVKEIVNNIKNTKQWRLPSLERFLFDFLNYIIKDDLKLLKEYDDDLDEIELGIINDDSNI